jgi:quercetin dioxygenase-like cupin family protein
MSQSIAASQVRFLETDSSSALDILGMTIFPLVSNRESGDQFGLFQALIPPGAGIPPHTHPDVEVFYVLDGELKILLDGSSFTSRRDQGGFVPSNALHGFQNEGAETVRVLITCTRGLESFLLEAGTPLSDVQPGPPSPGEIARVFGIAAKHGQQFPRN